MSRVVRVDEEVYALLIAEKARMELALGRPVSLSDAVASLAWPARCRGCSARIHEVRHPTLGEAWADEDGRVACPHELLVAHVPAGQSA